MSEDLLRQRQAHRLEHDRPVGRVKFQNVLADHVKIGGPQFNFGFRISDSGFQGLHQGRVAVSGRHAEVVHQRIEPDPGNEVFIKWQGDAPIQACHRASDAKIFEHVVLQQAEHFVAAVGRLDEFRISFQVADQPRLLRFDPKPTTLMHRLGITRDVMFPVIDACLLARLPKAQWILEQDIDSHRIFQGDAVLQSFSERIDDETRACGNHPSHHSLRLQIIAKRYKPVHQVPPRIVMPDGGALAGV